MKLIATTFKALGISGLYTTESNAVHARKLAASCDTELREPSLGSSAGGNPQDTNSATSLSQDSCGLPCANLATCPSQVDDPPEDEELRRHLSLKESGTCCWIFDTNAYRAWHDSPDQAGLFIEGLAGTGKSILASSVIDHLQKTEPNSLILYFFFRPNLSGSKRLPASLILNWLAKSLQQSLYIQQEFGRLGRRQPGGLTEDAQWDFLLASLPSIGTVYCVVDALDQVDPRHTMILATRLYNIAILRPRAVKVLMTSRPRQALRSSLLVTSSLHISMDQDRILNDIKYLVRQRLHRALPDYILTAVRETIASNILTSLPVHSGGPFLYAHDLIDKLTGLETFVDLERSPLAIEDVYHVMKLLVDLVPRPNVPSPPKRPSQNAKSFHWRDYRLKIDPTPTKTAEPKVNEDSQDRLLPGQTCFQMRDTIGVRHHLVRLFIDRRLYRDNGNVPPGKEPLLHSLFENICCAISCLEVISEYIENINFNDRDTKGRTLLHAACNAKVLRAAYLLPGNAHIPRGEVWYRGTGLFLRMLDLGAPAYAVDKEGRNTLHILLNNPSMCEDHILTFLERYGTRELVCRRDERGFNALHCALRILRPKVCEILLSYGADLLDPDPDGNTALHHIARQCLSRDVDDLGSVRHTSCKPSSEYLKTCLSLWRNYLSLGGSINVLNFQGLPPLFYYLSSACGQQGSADRSKSLIGNESETPEEDDCMHFQHICVFFAGADWQPLHHFLLEGALVDRRDSKEVHHNKLLAYVEKWFLK